VGFLSTLQQNFPSLLVCNARKWEQSRKTEINFSSDGRLGLVFLCWNENDKNYVMGGTFSWFDLPIKLHKNKEVSRARTVQWYGFRFCRRISLIASDTYGAEATWSLAFSCCLVSTEHDLCHRCFLSAFQQNFPGLLVCNARKREQSRKTAINFPSDGRLGPVFFLPWKWQELCRESLIYLIWPSYKITHKKRFLWPEQSNGMDSASAVASPSSLLTPTGRKEHDL